MKHNLLKSVILSVILLMGVSNAWAASEGSSWYDWASSENVYFDNTNSSYSNVSMLIGRQWNYGGDGVGSSGVNFTKVANTNNLYHAATTWNHYNTLLFMDETGWGWEGNKVTQRYTYADNYTNTNNVDINGTELFYADSSTKGATLNHQDLSGYEALNFRQTIQSAVNGAVNGAVANSKATISITSYKMTAHKTTTEQTATLGTGANVSYITAARTAITTLTVGDVATGYQFDGWYTAATGGTQLSIDETYTYYPTAATTVYARFSNKKYTITYKDQGGSNFSGSHATGYPTQHTYGTTTTLSTATKDGYTFGGWHTDQECTQKVTSLGATTAAITLYAKWTINQYTLTYSAGEGGSVTGTKESGATLDYNTSITLTAAPEGENAFAQWVNEEGVKVSTANPYTFELKANTIIKAEFSKPTTVYLKTSDDWKANNAYFAIYAWGGKSGDPWVDMEAVDCEGEYYKANVPAGFSDFAFVRLKSGGGHDWANKLNQTGNLTVQTNGKNMYDVEDKTMTYIHLEAKAWDNGDARFAAYFFGNGDQWVNLTKNGDVYSCKKPEGYTSVIFCRMNKNSADNNFNNCWNKTKDLSLMDNGDNCFWIDTDNSWGCAGNVPGDEANDGDGDRDGADGGWYRLLDDSQWKAFAPTYTVTLNPFLYGEYGVLINGKTYMSKQSESVVIENIALGEQVEVIDAVSTSTHYGEKLDANGENLYKYNVVVQKNSTSTSNSYPDDGDKFIHTVCGNTTFKPNMVTTAAHRVYLHIPSDLLQNWKNGGSINCIYATEYLTNANDGRPGALIQMTKDNALSNLGKGEYYYGDIPAGYNKFYFESKTAADNSSAKNLTKTFYYQIPLTNLNCFTLTSSAKPCEGSWEVVPATDGDFRVLYVEQQVAEEDWKTVIDTTDQHSSDIIKKRTATGTDIVSLHINYDETKHPRIILQQMSSGKWVDVEGQARMAVGPLTATADKAMAPGRRNAAGEGLLTYDDGIEEIKQDKQNGYAGRVWNFTVQQTVDNGNVTAKLLLEELEPYSGDYYIRTDNAEGGWEKYTLPGNIMNHSQYAEDHSDYSHYFCKYVDITTDPKNVKFVISNDYGLAISDTLDGDDFVPTQNNGSVYKGELQQSANVRWSWNQYTNEVKRAYIEGSSVNNFLTVTQESGTTTEFKDNGNWIYEADITAAVGDKITAITAPYRDQDQSLLEQRYEDGMPLLTGDPNGTHKIRVMYDFKINKTMALLVPGTGVKTTIDVLIERTDHGQATQVANAIQKSDESDGYTVYAALNFTENNVVNAQYTAQRLYYWVSFPFDVRISEVFGFGEYGKHWIMQYYDGAARAANGAWADSPSYWRNITDTANLDNSTTLNSGILKANQGYVLALAKKIATMGVFEHTKTVTLYFPSREKQHIMNPGVKTIAVELESHLCGINRPTPDGDRRIKDSHWHVLGVPSYSDHSQTLTQNDLMFFYQRKYDSADGYTVQSTNTVTLQSLHSYYVQFAGTINWAAEWKLSPLEIAARKNVAAEDNYNLRLELQQNGSNADQTFITLKDEDGITPTFDMNKDLTKIINSGVSVYTLIATDRDPIEVAGNVLPIANTVIPVGVQVATAGEYTFAMPDGTDGVVVELIDYEYNTRTNLLFSEYTVNLPAGTNDTQFALSVKPDKTATSMENITTPSDGELRKFIIDGVLYMQKDGVLYDAQGKLVR